MKAARLRPVLPFSVLCRLVTHSLSPQSIPPVKRQLFCKDYYQKAFISAAEAELATNSSAEIE